MNSNILKSIVQCHSYDSSGSRTVYVLGTFPQKNLNIYQSDLNHISHFLPFTGRSQEIQLQVTCE
jgi:hypothetical protein